MTFYGFPDKHGLDTLHRSLQVSQNTITVQILCIGTDRSQQTVQTKIRLLLKKQSDQGLRCLSFHQHLLDALMQSCVKLFYFWDNYGNSDQLSHLHSLITVFAVFTHQVWTGGNLQIQRKAAARLHRFTDWSEW